MHASKQLRINDKTGIRNRIVDFRGKTITLVLTDSRVVTGVIEKTTDTNVTIRNMRLKKMEYAFEKISELYFDTVVEC